MARLLIRFVVNLERHEPGPALTNHGPLFHRWLPNGQSDAIALDLGTTSARLKVWFEMRGFVDGGVIRFAYDRREVDPDVIPRQGLLEGGPLCGSLEVDDLTGDDIACLARNKPGDAGYIAIGKRVVTLFVPPVRRFLEILRNCFGQYWVASLEEWDSRRMSLGAYCGRLQLRGSIDEGSSWFDLVPDEQILRSNVFLVEPIAYREYLTQEAWGEFRDVVDSDFSPGLPWRLLIRAHELADQDELRFAFIEGVAALEAVLSESVRSGFGSSRKVGEAAQAFWTIPLRAQAVILTHGTGRARSEDVEAMLEGIEIRNRILHEGWTPPEDEAGRRDLRKLLMGLLGAAASLLEGPRVRFPAAHPGNTVVPSEKGWDELYARGWS